LLDRYAPDISVVQECPRPEVQNDHCLWFGDNPKQGIAVFAKEPFSVRALPQLQEVPAYAFPVQVIGPVTFVLLAVWSKKNPQFPYIEGVVRAVSLYRDLMITSPAVVMGDLNSNAIWDSDHPQELNHSALVSVLQQLGMVSSYHAYFNEEHGSERRPTHYFRWQESSPFHIDYCFIPKDWANRLRAVEVGTFSEWKDVSDHRPLMVEINEHANAG